MMPVQMNFTRTVLDMGKQEDRDEYERIMNYLYAGYGMKILYLDRRFIRKRMTSKKPESAGKTRRKTVQIITVEYIAPYKIPSDVPR